MTGCTEVITHKNELYSLSYTIFAQSKRNFFQSVMFWTINNNIMNDI